MPRFLRHLARQAACLTFLLAACLCLGGSLAPRIAAAEDITITYASFGGALQKAEEAAWLKPFMAKNPGVKIVYDNVDYAKLKAMVEANNVVWDVAVVANDFGLTSDEPLLEKIDCSIVPCDQLQPDRFPTTGYRAAHSTSGLAIGYNTKKMPNGQIPQNWADFFDVQKFPGKRVVMMDASSYVFEQALLGDGVTPKDLYPLDINRAIKKLNSIGSNLMIAPSYQGCAELLATGEAVMAGCWTGRLTGAKYNAGAPVDIQWNQGIISPGYLVIPKGSKHKDLAMKLIAYITSAENNAKQAEFIDYGPTNANALDKVDPAKKDRLQSSHLDVSVFLDDRWYDKNRPEVSKRFAEWLAGMQ
jgi:putative spermidine/putrescine transport system substrate-binding protein